MNKNVHIYRPYKDRPERTENFRTNRGELEQANVRKVRNNSAAIKSDARQILSATQLQVIPTLTRSFLLKMELKICAYFLIRFVLFIFKNKGGGVIM